MVQPLDATSPSDITADKTPVETTRDDRLVARNGLELETEYQGDMGDSSIHVDGSSERGSALQNGSEKADAVTLPLNAVRPDAWADSYSGSDASGSDSDSDHIASLPASAAACFAYRYELGAAQQADNGAVSQEKVAAAGADEGPIESSGADTQHDDSHGYGSGYSPDLHVRFAAAAAARQQATAAVTAAAAAGRVTGKVFWLTSYQV